MALEITGTYVDEACDLCQTKGAPENNVIEFGITRTDGDYDTISIHENCLSKMLKNRGLCQTTIQ